MMRIFNINGLFALIYMAHHYQSWIIQENTTNILSPFLICFFKKLPSSLGIILFILILLLYIWSIYKNRYTFLLYLCSLTLCEIILKICIDTIMLNGTSNFFLCSVTHYIPLDMKLNYLNDTLYRILDSVSPELLKDPVFLEDLKSKLNNLVDVNKIAHLNAEGIHNYSYELLNKYYDLSLNENKTNFNIINCLGILSLVHLVIKFIHANFNFIT